MITILPGFDTTELANKLNKLYRTPEEIEQHICGTCQVENRTCYDCGIFKIKERLKMSEETKGCFDFKIEDLNVKLTSADEFINNKELACRYLASRATDAQKLVDEIKARNGVMGHITLSIPLYQIGKETQWES
jgi:hypothetical protein